MATIEAIKRNGNIIFPLTSANAIVNDKGNRVSVLVSEPVDNIDYTTDYVLMTSDIVQNLGDNENKIISQKATKNLLENKISSSTLTAIERISEDEYNTKQSEGTLSETTLYIVV